MIKRVLPKRPEAAAAARRVIDALDGVLDPAARDTARLLVSEVVANAVRHVPESGSIALAVDVCGRHVHIEIEDPGHGFEFRPRRPDSPRNGGWGLHFVDMLSERWGARDGRVWFELPARAGRPTVA